MEQREFHAIKIKPKHHMPMAILCLVVCLFTVMPSAANNQNLTEDVSSYIPADLSDAHRQLRKILSAETINEMRISTEEDMVLYHLGLGMWIRNNWIRAKGSRLKNYFNGLGIFHPDDMSGIILDTFWCDLNGKPHRLDEKVDYYKKFWKSNEKSKTDNPVGDTNTQ